MINRHLRSRLLVDFVTVGLTAKPPRAPRAPGFGWADTPALEIEIPWRGWRSWRRGGFPTRDSAALHAEPLPIGDVTLWRGSGDHFSTGTRRFIRWFAFGRSTPRSPPSSRPRQGRTAAGAHRRSSSGADGIDTKGRSAPPDQS